MDILFGKKPDPREQAREWERTLKKEERELEKQLRHIKRDEDKVKLSMKQHAKKGEVAEARILAKALVQSKKSRNRIHTTKTQISSIGLEMKAQIRMLRMSAALQKSIKVMESMNALVDLRSVSTTMNQLSKEMAKAGFIEETIEEAMPLDDDELDAEVDEEVMKVLEEVCGIMPEANTAKPAGPEEVEEAVDDADVERFMASMTAS